MKGKTFLIGLFVLILLSTTIYAQDCEENWECTNWGTCVNGEQTRSCTDHGFCNIEANRPPETQTCTEGTETPTTTTPTLTPPTTCTEDWTCGLWSDCENELQRRSCIDRNLCDTQLNRPELERSCEAATTETPITTETQPTVTPEPEEEGTSLTTILLYTGLAIVIIAGGIAIYLYLKNRPKPLPAQPAVQQDMLANYIQKMQASGYNNQTIRNSLIQSGYPEDMINKHLPQNESQLKGYTKQMLEQGYNYEHIEDNLKRFGYREYEIKKILGDTNGQTYPRTWRH